MMIFANLKNTLKNHKELFLFLSLIQMISVVVIMFSYGIFVNSKLGLNDLYYEGQLYDPTFKLDENVVLDKNVKEKLPKLLEKYGEYIEKCSIHTEILKEDAFGEKEFANESYNEYYVSEINVKDGKITNESTLRKKYILGRVLTDEDENGNEPVCVTTRYRGKAVGEVIEAGDYTYKIVGMENYDGYESDDYQKINSYWSQLYLDFSYMRAAFVPFEYHPENAHIMMVFIRFKRVIMSKEIDDLNKGFKEIFGDSIVSYPQGIGISYDKKKTYISLMWIVCILAVLASYCILSIYMFIIRRRERETGIYIICGAPKRKIIGSYINEMLIQFLVSACIGFLLFQNVLRKWLDVKYKWFYYIFHEQLSECLKLLAVFGFVVVSLTCISIALRIKKTPISIIKQN